MDEADEYQMCSVSGCYADGSLYCDNHGGAALRALVGELAEALGQAEEYMTMNIPGNSYGLRDKDADAGRHEALLVMRAALKRAESLGVGK